MTIIRLASAAGSACCVLFAAGLAARAAQPVEWADLRPDDQPSELTAAQRAEIGRTATAALDGQSIEITGYMIPSDREGDRVYEFLLVPWAGACSHMPAPAPNQVLRVHARTPFSALGNYEIVTVTGRLTGSADLTQLFILDGVTTVESAYQLSATAITSHGLPLPDTLPAPSHGRSPWNFLNR